MNNIRLTIMNIDIFICMFLMCWSCYWPCRAQICLFTNFANTFCTFTMPL